MIEKKKNKFHLSNTEMSYVIEIDQYQDILHLYWGKIIDFEQAEIPTAMYAPACAMPKGADMRYNLCQMPCEYPTTGGGDYRAPALEIELPNGCSTIRPKYKDYEILNGKTMPEKLPAVYVENADEAQTLKIFAEDKEAGIELVLYYTIFEKLNVVCRRTEILNTGNDFVFVRNAQSVAVDFPVGEYEYIHLEGCNCREKHVERVSVHKGEQGFESRRGASGHAENPFLALMERGANEDYGNVYGFSLVYSGNHKFEIELEAFESPRVLAGINPYAFCYKLERGEKFVTPEAVMVYSGSGLGEMSRTFHRLYRTRLCRGKYKNMPRPILINNWEATYFDFNREKLLDIAERAAQVGIELFVLDDGWFGHRNNDASSLGDWFENREKLGGSIGELAEAINKKGLKFGLWLEPEMISEDSELYRAHPDWAIHIPNREPLYSRHQFVLDYTRSDVREYMISVITKLLSGANIEYVKWDMNRNITDAYTETLPYDRQGEFYHRYILGLYEVLDTVTTKFDQVLFEGCAGGGGRNDPGMLYYMPQNWASDDTDAVERMFIQYGASMVYPSVTVGAHVSAVPNHQIGRTTSLSLRGTVAMNGAFGYELDITKLSDEEMSRIGEQVQQYKRIRGIVANGDLYRLMNPYTSRAFCWMYVSEDRNDALLYYAVHSVRSCINPQRIQLKGLDENKHYSLNGKIYSGRTLMRYGIFLSENEVVDYNFIWELHSADSAVL